MRTGLTADDLRLLQAIVDDGGTRNIAGHVYKLAYDRLEQEGLITATRAGLNVVRVELTEIGRKACAESSPSLEQ